MDAYSDLNHSGMSVVETWKPELIVIGGSAGSFKVVQRILSSIRNIEDCPPIVLCLHRLRNVRSGFAEALSYSSVAPVIEPDDKDRIRRGHIYLAPANYHLCIELGKTFALSTESPVHNSRPSIDLLFDSAGYVYKRKLMGIILSGANRDGAHGLRRIKEFGGMTIVQDPEEAEILTMPQTAMKVAHVDAVLRTDAIIDLINEKVALAGKT